MEYLFISLIVRVICGAIASAIASNKGRSTVGWFFGGFFFALLAIIIVACLSNKKDEKAYQDHVAQENRRLREKLDQERLKTEALRQHVVGRLDLHDAQLGIDTRSFRTALPGPDGQNSLTANDELDALFADESPQAPVDTLPEPVAELSPYEQAPPPQESKKPSTRQWFFEQNGKSQGPVLEPELLSMFQAGRLDGTTLVWTESLTDWVAAKRVKLLKPHIQS
jgi:hypothetical protein